MGDPVHSTSSTTLPPQTRETTPNRKNRRRTKQTTGPGHLISKCKQFQKRISMVSSLYPCPHHRCLWRLKPGTMERHFRVVHEPFDPSVSCVWCDGAFGWPRGQKNRHINHMSQCFQTYCEKVARPEEESRQLEEPLTVEGEEDGSWIDPEEQRLTPNEEDFSCSWEMYGRRPILSDYAYRPLFLDIDNRVFPKRRVLNLLEFDNEVELARCYLDLYCQWNGVGECEDGYYDSNDDDDDDMNAEETVATWYHLMVSAFALERFVQAVIEFGEDKVFTLPFWCWCDGAPYEQDMFRHHRHMILVVRNGCLFKERCWNKFSSGTLQGAKENGVDDEMRETEEEEEEDLRAEEAGSNESLDKALRPPEGFSLGHLKKIRTWLQLVTTMRDLSNRLSRCCYDCKRDRRGLHTGEWKDKHFCFGENWHNLGMLCLVCVTSRNGLQGMFEREEHLFQVSQQWDTQCFVRVPNNRGSWHVRVGDVKNLHVVLPVKKGWRPTKILHPNTDEWRTHKVQQDKTAFLYLMEGKKLVFEKDESLESLPEDEWLLVQTQGVAKNLFYDVIADTWWKLNPRLQASLDFGEKYAQMEIKRTLAAKTEEMNKERDNDAWRWREREQVWVARENELRNELESLRVVRGRERSNGSNGSNVTVQYWTVGSVYYQVHSS